MCARCDEDAALLVLFSSRVPSMHLQTVRGSHDCTGSRFHPEPGCCSFDTPALAMVSVVAPTLRTHGPAFTEGGVLHPHGCTPCAFYCYKKGGCWKDIACTYCHMMHVSNHRMRRDEWKKRRSRDRVATEHCAVYNTVPADTPCYISLSGGCCVLHA